MISLFSACNYSHISVNSIKIASLPYTFVLTSVIMLSTVSRPVFYLMIKSLTIWTLSLFFKSKNSKEFTMSWF